MKKSIVSKFTALLMAAILLCTLFAGCSKSGKPDSQESQPSADSSKDSSGDSSAEADETGEKPELNIVLELAPQTLPEFSSVTARVGSLKDFNVVIDQLPDSGPDRSNRITRIRTEIMAGKGPDVFVCDGYTGNLMDDWETTLFQFPEKAMKNQIFLPLDEYMENAQQTDFSKLVPALMEAGRNEEGQQILPVLYTFKAGNLVADRHLEGDKLPSEEYQLPKDLPKTHQEMLTCGDKVLESAACPMGNTELSYFGQPADVLNEDLNFTEEELLQLALEVRDSYEKYRGGYFDGITGEDGWKNGYYTLRNNLSHMFLVDNKMAEKIDNDTDFTLVADRNRDGGITAEISMFAAVSRNTQHPQEAFDVLDALLSEQVQANTTIYMSLFGIPSSAELGTREKPYRYSGYGWLMNEGTFAQFTALRDQINAVRFVTPLDREFNLNLFEVCRKEGVTEDEIKRAVHNSYTTMKMMLAES